MHAPAITPAITIDDLGTYPFERTRKLLASVHPEVPESLNLTIGQPKVSPPEWVIKQIAQNDQQWHLYPPIPGTAELQQAIKNWLITRFELSAHTEDFSVEPTCGSREGLYLLATATRFLPCGKKRLIGIPNPGYAVYAGSARISGATTLALDCHEGKMPAPNSISATQREQLQLVYICSPDNPSGRIMPLAEMSAWIKAAREYNFILASDECYSELYSNTPPTGILQAACEIAQKENLVGDKVFENIVCLNSLSKRSSVAGLRSALLAGDHKILALIRKIKSYAGNRMPLALQHASTALWQDDKHVDTIRKHYRANYALANQLFASTDQPTIEAGMFLWLKVDNDQEAAKLLWRKAGLRTIPGSYLCENHQTKPGDHYLRIALVDHLDVLEQALHSIHSFIGEIR